MRKWIYNEYGLKAEKMEKLGRYEAMIAKNQHYFVVPVENVSDEEIAELQQMSLYMFTKGDGAVATFVPTRMGSFVTQVNEKRIVVLRGNIQPYARTLNIGRELAKFHQRGRTYPYPVRQCNRIGQWKELWGKRVDQMEAFWRGKVQMHPENAFERLFIESFPYYLGIAENAIQYLVDTELDDQPQGVDYATICHQRFTIGLWRNDYEIKFPTDWVYDHCARDLAEWVRHFFQTTKFIETDKIRQFFQEYQRVTPLTPFSWRLIYSRLLFPLHYFECIEGYYLAQKDEEKAMYERKLSKMLNDSQKYERFLAMFYELAGFSVNTSHVPRIKWLEA